MVVDEQELAWPRMKGTTMNVLKQSKSYLSIGNRQLTALPLNSRNDS